MAIDGDDATPQKQEFDIINSKLQGCSRQPVLSNSEFVRRPYIQSENATKPSESRIELSGDFIKPSENLFKALEDFIKRRGDSGNN